MNLVRSCLSLLMAAGIACAEPVPVTARVEPPAWIDASRAEGCDVIAELSGLDLTDPPSQLPVDQLIAELDTASQALRCSRASTSIRTPSTAPSSADATLQRMHAEVSLLRDQGYPTEAFVHAVDGALLSRSLLHAELDGVRMLGVSMERSFLRVAAQAAPHIPLDRRAEVASRVQALAEPSVEAFSSGPEAAVYRRYRDGDFDPHPDLDPALRDHAWFGRRHRETLELRGQIVQLLGPTDQSLSPL